MLSRMVEIYCLDQHSDREKSAVGLKGVLETLEVESPNLCGQCSRLLTHGLVKRLSCPFDSMPGKTKPRCKHCSEPCYSGEYRNFVKQVMRYSGLRLIRAGRIDLIWKYFF